MTLMTEAPTKSAVERLAAFLESLTPAERAELDALTEVKPEQLPALEPEKPEDMEPDVEPANEGGNDDADEDIRAEGIREARAAERGDSEPLGGKAQQSHDAAPTSPVVPATPAVVPQFAQGPLSSDKGLVAKIGAFLKRFAGMTEPEPQAAPAVEQEPAAQPVKEHKAQGVRVFKALGDGWWIGAFSNNFKDRDGEILTEAAHDRYILRANLGYVPMPELWYHHIPGTKHGKAVLLDRAGHIIYAVGKFDDTPLGRKMEALYAAGDQDWGMSHGFTAEPWAKTEDGLFLDYNSFEITTLDPASAANEYAMFVSMEALNMALSERQREAMRKRLPDDVRALVEDAHKEFEAQGATLAKYLGSDHYKDYVDLTGTGKPPTNTKAEGDPAAGAAAEAEGEQADTEGAFAQMLVDLMGQHNQLATLVNAMAARQSDMAKALGLEEEAASESSETEVDAEAPAAKAAAEAINNKTATEVDNFLPGLFSKPEPTK